MSNRHALGIVVTLLLLMEAAAYGQSLPIGSIVAYGGDAAKNEQELKQGGWLPCDGRALRAKDPASGQPTEYANLFAVLEESFGEGYEEGMTDKNAGAKKGDFNLPDCRGRFLRGVDGGTGRDPDRGDRTPMRHGGNAGDAVGSVQDDELRSHDHGATGNNVRAVFWSAPVGQAEMKRGMNNGGDFHDNGASGISRGTEAVSVTVSPRGGSETRPKNLNVHWIIRYK